MIPQWAVNDISRQEKPYARGLVQHQSIKLAPVRESALLMPLFTWWDLLSGCNTFERRICLSFSNYIYISQLSFPSFCVPQSPITLPPLLSGFIQSFQTCQDYVIGLTIFCRGPSTSLVWRFFSPWLGYHSVVPFSSLVFIPVPLLCLYSMGVCYGCLYS